MNILHNFTDPETGNTYKEDNLKRVHRIPLGALVEVDAEDIDEHGTRLFVVGHDRDCDGTPIYSLSFDKEAKSGKHDWMPPIFRTAMTTGGFSEESLYELEP